jgi:hypothetical protein
MRQRKKNQQRRSAKLRELDEQERGRGRPIRRDPTESRKDRVALLETKCMSTVVSPPAASEELEWLGRIDCSTWPAVDAARYAFVSQVLKAIVAGTRPSNIAQPDGGFFRWPSTEVSNGVTKTARIEAVVAVGMLSTVGYHVGVNGLSSSVRQRILERIYRDELPRSFPKEYLAEWGQTATASRLRKLANTIAALTRNMKRRSPGAAATDDWEMDLGMLKRRFYDGKYDFPWPRSN